MFNTIRQLFRLTFSKDIRPQPCRTFYYWLEGRSSGEIRAKDIDDAVDSILKHLADSKGVDVEIGWAARWNFPIILMRAVAVDNMLVGDPSDYTYTFERLDVPTWLKLREKGASHV